MPLGTDPFDAIFNNMLHICKLRFLIVIRLGNLMEKSKISAYFENNVSK